jgi:HlyD family secretion protein
MKTKAFIYALTALTTLASCGGNGEDFDAPGVFEGEEVLVSAEAAGRILELNANEGDTLAQGDTIGAIDAGNLTLQKEQLEAVSAALQDRTVEAQPQIDVLARQRQVQENQLAALREQLRTLNREKARVERLVAAEAATAKQLDDLAGQASVQEKQVAAAEAQLAVLDAQIAAQRRQEALQNRAILSEQSPNAGRISIVEDQIRRARIVNPATGTVLTTYARAGESTAPGKALYKIADLRELTLRAYVTGDQLAGLKLGQSVAVFTDDGQGGYRQYAGKLYWISAKAEFTPRTILTKDERANQVYAIKVRVPNDGYLKIGMHGEIKI